MKKFDINNIFKAKGQYEAAKATVEKVHKAVQGEWTIVPSWEEGGKEKEIVNQWGKIYNLIAKHAGNVAKNPVAFFSILSEKYNPNYQIFSIFLGDIRTIRNRMVYDNKWVELDDEAMDVLRLCEEFCEYAVTLPLLEQTKAK